MYKTDVFIRVFSSNELRLGMAIATVARWKMQKDARVNVLDCCDIQCNNYGYDFRHDGTNGSTLQNRPIPFATQSLKYAEENSRTDIYIVCNDDNLIYGSDFIEKGLKLMEKNPEYGCISGIYVNGSHFNTDKPITEIHAVGSLVFLRKGLVTEFPPLQDCSWDGERHRQVVEKGFKSGYARDLKYLHMGENFSVANPEFFVGA